MCRTMSNCVCACAPTHMAVRCGAAHFKGTAITLEQARPKRILAEPVSLSSSRSHPHSWEATKMSGMSAAHWRKSCRSHHPPPPVKTCRTGTWRSELRRRGVPARTSAAATRGHSVTRNGFVSSQSRVFPLHHRLPDDCCVFHASLKEAAQNNKTTKHEDSFLSAAPTTKRCCLTQTKKHALG